MSKRPVIALLAAPETSASVLYGLFDVLYAVGTVYPDMVIGEPGETLLDVRIVAAGKTPFRCAGNILIEPHAALADLATPDIAIVCDLYIPTDTAPRGRYAAEIEWLRKAHASGTLIASVCSGSLVLAEGGLLDGRHCAGHWAYRDLFRTAYPQVKFRDKSVLNLESEAEGIVTAGSATAWQDLALFIIARYCGIEHALRTAKTYLLSGHDEAGQLPFAAMSRRIQAADAVIASCQSWIADNYQLPNPVAGMAERSGLGARTFARRFRAATGYLPIDYVHALRIEEARQIIETEPTALDEVGATVGYEDPTFFRRLFKRRTGLTPAAYRKKFQGIVAIASGRPQGVSAERPSLASLPAPQEHPNR
jgi:transcriptional regulator GlxA family with amidase domain